VIIADLVAKLRADPSDFIKGTERARDELGRFVTTAKTATGSSGGGGVVGMLGPLGKIGGLAATAFAGFGAASFAKEAIFGFNSQLQNAEMAFTSMMGSGEKAQAFLGDLKQFAIATPFEFTDLVSASQRMTALGFSAEDILPALQKVGDASAAMGGSKDVLDGVIRAMGQIKMKGKVQAEEMNQLAERGIPGWEMLAEKIGVSIPEAMEMSRKGAIDADTAIAALLEGMDKRYGGLMEKQSQSFTGAMSNIKDAAIQTIGGGFKPLFDILTKAGVAFAAFLGSEKVKSFVEAFASGFATVIQFLLDAGGKVIEFINGFGGVGAIMEYVIPIAAALAGYLAMTGAIAGIGKLVGVISNIGKALAGIMTANPILLIVALIIGGLVLAYQKVEWFRDGVNTAFAFLKDTVIPAVVTGFKTFIDTFVSGSNSITQSGFLQFIQEVAIGARDFWDALYAAGQTAVSWVKDTAWPAMQTAFDGIKSAIEAVKGPLEDFGNFWTERWDAIKEATTNVVNVLKPILLVLTAPLWLPIIAGIKMFQWIWENAGDKVMEIVRTLVDLVKNQFQAFVRVIGGVIDVVLGLLTLDWDRIKSGFGNIVGGIIDGFKNLIPSLFRIFQSVLTIVIRAFGSIGGWLLGWLGDVAGWLLEKGAGLVTGMLSGMLGAIGGIRDFFLSLPGTILGLIGDAASWLLEKGKDILTGLWDGIEELAPKVWSWFSDLPGKVIDHIGSVNRTLREKGIQLITGLRDGIVEWVPNIWNWLKSFPGNVLAFIGNLGSTLLNKGIDLVTGLVSGLLNAAPRVWSFISGIPGNVLRFIGSLISTLLDKGSDLMTGLKNGITSAWESVRSWVADIPDKLSKAVGSLSSVLYGAGRNLVDGLKNGISAAWSGVSSFVQEQINKIPSIIRRLMGIDSPSKVMMKIGTQIGDGLFLGLQDGFSKVDGLVGTASASLTPSITGSLMASAGQAVAAGSTPGWAGAGSATYVINVNTGVGDGVEIGRTVVDYITTYERVNGKGWRAA
jgi:tape measure domain-containing protein